MFSIIWWYLASSCSWCTPISIQDHDQLNENVKEKDKIIKQLELQLKILNKDKKAIEIELENAKCKIVMDACCKVCSEITLPKERMMEHENKDCGKCS